MVQSTSNSVSVIHNVDVLFQVLDGFGIARHVGAFDHRPDLVLGQDLGIFLFQLVLQDDNKTMGKPNQAV